MKSRLMLGGMSVLALSWGVSMAQAGVIRATARQIDKGSTTIVRKTPEAADAAAGGVATAGKAAGGVIKTGAISAGKGIAAIPGLTVRGTAGAAKAISKAVW